MPSFDLDESSGYSSSEFSSSSYREVMRSSFDVWEEGYPLSDHGAKGPHFLLLLAWATHGCDYNFSGPCGQLSTYAVERFLDAVTD
jgi:hypothetical protein